MKTKKKKSSEKEKKSVTKEVGGWEAGFELKVEEVGGRKTSWPGVTESGPSSESAGG